MIKMRSLFILILASFITAEANAQIPKSGSYIYKYCDLEYNACISKCKIKIKGNKIWVYAPPGLTLVKEGDLIDSGTVSKHSSGKWVILHSKNKNSFEAFEDTNEPMIWLDFKKKQFWTF